jgi:hypothetical protein
VGVSFLFAIGSQTLKDQSFLLALLLTPIKSLIADNVFVSWVQLASYYPIFLFLAR